MTESQAEDQVEAATPRMSTLVFILLTVAAFAVVVGGAYLIGRSLDGSEQAQGPNRGIEQAIPVPPQFAPAPPPPTLAPIPVDERGVPVNDGSLPSTGDHWHSVYGVYSCDLLGDGEAKYLPAFQSTQDDSGLHSHGDGLVHIHPFFEEFAADGAVMAVWFDEMHVDISVDRIVVENEFDPLAEHVAGEPCFDGTGPSEIVVLVWDRDSLALAETPVEPDVIRNDFGGIRFENDRQVFVIAHAAIGTDYIALPLPPADRFASLINVSAAE